MPRPIRASLAGARPGSDGGHHARGNAGRHTLLGPEQESVVEHEDQHCEYRCRGPFARAWRALAQELRTAAVALHRSTESVGAEAEVGWRETRRGQFCRRRDGRGAKNGERDYRKSPREERGRNRLREAGGEGRDGWELAARDGVSVIRRGRGWAAETWTDNDTTGAPRPAWKAHIDAPTWSAARQKQNIGRRSPRESG